MPHNDNNPNDNNPNDNNPSRNLELSVSTNYSYTILMCICLKISTQYLYKPSKPGENAAQDRLFARFTDDDKIALNTFYQSIILKTWDPTQVDQLYRECAEILPKEHALDLVERLQSGLEPMEESSERHQKLIESLKKYAEKLEVGMELEQAR